MKVTHRTITDQQIMELLDIASLSPMGLVRAGFLPPDGVTVDGHRLSVVTDCGLGLRRGTARIPDAPSLSADSNRFFRQAARQRLAEIFNARQAVPK